MIRKATRTVLTEARRMAWDSPSGRAVLFLVITYPLATALELVA